MVLIKSQAASLPSELRAEYIRLLVDGSPHSVAAARSLHDDARVDLQGIRDCREALQLLAEARKPGPRRNLEKVQDKLTAVRDEISRLEELESELAQQVATAENNAPSPRQFERRVAMCTTNQIVRQALAAELKQAGV
jgi:predicted  nucleic acid-binding Zn-ribbon protein